MIMSQGTDKPPQASLPRATGKGRILPLVFQVVLSAVLIIFVAKNLDWRALGVMAKQLSALFWLGSSSLMCLSTVIFTFRWQQILASMGYRPPLRLLVRQNFVGIFFNNFAPSMLGQDAAKTYYLGRSVGYVAAGTSVLMDKIIGLGSLTFLGAVLVLLLGFEGPLYTVALTMALLLSAAAALALCGIRLPIERLLPSVISRWSLGRRVIDLLTRTRSEAGGALSLRTFAASAAVVLVTLLLMAGIYAWFLTEATGTSPGIASLMCVLCLVNTVSNLPLSINGIGVREQAHALLLAGIGVPLEAAIGLSLLQYVFFAEQSVIGWLLWLRRHRYQESAS